jgi:hypothetical protein
MLSSRLAGDFAPKGEWRQCTDAQTALNSISTAKSLLRRGLQRRIICTEDTCPISTWYVFIPLPTDMATGAENLMLAV